MANTKRARRAPQSGYQPCGCRDCFEIAIGLPGAFCHECQAAGCEPDSECCVSRDGSHVCESTLTTNGDGYCVHCGDTTS